MAIAPIDSLIERRRIVQAAAHEKNANIISSRKWIFGVSIFDLDDLADSIHLRLPSANWDINALRGEIISGSGATQTAVYPSLFIVWNYEIRLMNCDMNVPSGACNPQSS